MDSPQAILAARSVQFKNALSNEKFLPLVFPHDFVSVIIGIAVLLVRWPQNSILKYARYIFYVFMVCLDVRAMRTHRAQGMGQGYGVGLIFMWHIIWSAALLVFNDVQKDFKRIERRRESDERTIQPSVHKSNSNASLHRPRKAESSHSHSQEIHAASVDKRSSDYQSSVRYEWQPYPEKFSHRLAWVLELYFISFRGVGWNFGNPNLPPVPKKPETKIAIRHHLKNIAVSYITLDVLKVLAINDPYFWGLVNSPPPPVFAYFGRYAGLPIRLYHIGFIVAAVAAVLTAGHGAVCIVYLMVSLYFDRYIRTPIDALWLYPDIMGPIFPSVFDGGLAAAWNKGWHQVFRFGFVSPSTWLRPHLPYFLQEKNAFRILRITIAFVLSGLIHAAGSYTKLGDTSPWSGAFLFFFYQPLGIAAQQLLTKIAVYLNIPVPRLLSRWANFVFALCLIVLVVPLLADDFSRGGLWLCEPVPFSPLRSLVFGHTGESWWLWKDVLTLWKGQRWWDWGIQIL